MDLLRKAQEKQDLTRQEMAQAVDSMMRGDCDAAWIAAFLLALREKGEAVSEVTGAAEAMRRHMVPIRSSREVIVDTCGTGGDGSGTFNISTAAAIVTAAAGLAVAKHGNRSISSRSGSADVLAALGVNVEADVSTAERCLDELGICFCFAPRLHPAMGHVAAVRRELGVPTIFNLLGPLCNPAGAGYQLLGVGRAELHALLATALSELGTHHSLVVCGRDGLDELTLAAETDVFRVTETGLVAEVWDPADFGLENSSLQSLIVDGPPQSAAMTRLVLEGEQGPPRDIVLLNAAAALWLVTPAAGKPGCVARAAEAIDSGAAVDLLARWSQLSHSG